MSVRENVGFGPSMKGMPKANKNEIVNHLLDVVGLQDFKEKAVYELSGGMQQRVALARCLANDPDVILMDEPLGALDALTREKMQSLVLKLWKETGKTIILITPSVDEALLLGERVIVMAPRPGRIHKEYRLPFAEMGVSADLREVKKHPDFAAKREEILNMIWAKKKLWVRRRKAHDPSFDLYRHFCRLVLHRQQNPRRRRQGLHIAENSDLWRRKRCAPEPRGGHHFDPRVVRVVGHVHRFIPVAALLAHARPIRGHDIVRIHNRQRQ
jgi:energy-coupling factor transporter ATP-binding protein EcfA2